MSGREEIDFVALTAKIEELALAFGALPHLDYSKLKPNKEDRAKLKTLHGKALALFERADAELPPDLDLRPIKLARLAIGAVESDSYLTLNSLRRNKPQTSSGGERFLRAGQTMQEAVDSARRLRDHGRTSSNA